MCVYAMCVCVCVWMYVYAVRVCVCVCVCVCESDCAHSPLIPLFTERVFTNALRMCGVTVSYSVRENDRGHLNFDGHTTHTHLD